MFIFIAFKSYFKVLFRRFKTQKKQLDELTAFFVIFYFLAFLKVYVGEFLLHTQEIRGVNHVCP
jgi:hypothetical protein